jgi:hypothetical protein
MFVDWPFVSLVLEFYYTTYFVFLPYFSIYKSNRVLTYKTSIAQIFLCPPLQ